MKKFLTLLLIVPLLSMTVEIDNSKFIGKWVGEDGKEIGYITFDSEGYATFEIQGQVFGGKEFVLDGKRGKMTYEIKDGTEPIEVDLIMTNLDNGDVRTLSCIANFIDDNTMEFAMGFSDKRPTDFGGEDAIILKRVK
ncbi:hypothetical protein [Winogradskyella tangerina]|uniref:hypothetical protein n=1 Tax=Winogradskyella tangerina TaxID=2023240 RepID=UPI000DBE14E3|nr:hypothetical protein [Winogradskyella tangerina]